MDTVLGPPPTHTAVLPEFLQGQNTSQKEVMASVALGSVSWRSGHSSPSRHLEVTWHSSSQHK